MTVNENKDLLSFKGAESRVFATATGDYNYILIKYSFLKKKKKEGAIM